MAEVNELPTLRTNVRLINQEVTDPTTLGPIVGYTQEQLPSLLEACKPLIDVVDDILHYASIAIEKTPEHPPDELTQDESASIRLYTMEWRQKKTSLYSVLNRTLRTEHRDKLRPWFKYLALFLTALVKIPCAASQAVWRGVAQDISDKFPRGADVTWWSFSSCTTTLTVLESDLYLGNAESRTLFSIEVFNARNVSAHSYFQNEDEILLLPGTYMEVRSQLHPTHDLHIIHLKQKIPEEMLLEPPFPDAPLYPIEESFKIRFYRKKRWYIPITLVVVAIVIAIILGSVLGTKFNATTELDACKTETLSILTTNRYEASFGLWNTTAFGSSYLAAAGSGVGTYAVTSSPGNVLDQNGDTGYISFGSCSNDTISKSCGVDTGLIIIPEQGATLLLAVQFTTNGDAPESDPFSVTIEGSNQAFSTTLNWKNWSLIYNGSTGLDVDPGRTINGLLQCITNNTIWYTSYRILVTSKRGISSSVQYNEVKLYGRDNPNKAICDRTSLVSLTGNHEVVYGLWNTTVFGDGTLATSDSPIVNYVGYEGPKYALDKDRLTKYVNFGNCTVGTSQLDCGLNTGFYLTPQQGATLLLGIQFTTASDDSSRDPLSITIEGSNATSSALMLGTSWSLIYHSSTGLDMDPGRTMDGTFQCIFVNKNWYTSYRVLVASKRGESNSVQYAEVVLFGHKVPDKEWIYASNLQSRRTDHAAFTLSNGKVLVIGGYSVSGYLNSTELYDPSANTWSYAASLNNARSEHTLSILNNGKMLVAGGRGENGYMLSAELYDPSTNTWFNTANLKTNRAGHTASVLRNGKVLITGGYSSLDSTELYDPSTNTWSPAHNLTNGRSSHAASVLSNGKVLVIGGSGTQGYLLASTELYDPSTNTWSNVANLNYSRFMHTATLLSNGKVLVVGGFGSEGYVPSAELYDPSTNTWSDTSNLQNGRAQHTAFLLRDGKVLVTGGYNVAVGNLKSTELYDPSTNTWSDAGNLNNARDRHTASMLSNGKILVAGGYGGNSYLDSVELHKAFVSDRSSCLFVSRLLSLLLLSLQIYAHVFTHS